MGAVETMEAGQDQTHIKKKRKKREKREKRKRMPEAKRKECAWRGGGGGGGGLTK